MSKAIRPKDNVYIDSSGIVYGHTKLNDKLNAINEQIRYGCYGGTKSYPNGINDFKADLITSNYMVGCYFVSLNFNGSMSCALVHKANNNYLSFIHFSYGIIAKQYRYLTGNWYENAL